MEGKRIRGERRRKGEEGRGNSEDEEENILQVYNIFFTVFLDDSFEFRVLKFAVERGSVNKDYH